MRVNEGVVGGGVGSTCALSVVARLIHRIILGHRSSLCSSVITATSNHCRRMTVVVVVGVCACMYQGGCDDSGGCSTLPSPMGSGGIRRTPSSLLESTGICHSDGFQRNLSGICWSLPESAGICHSDGFPGPF
jgi:hypothetical protein